MKRIPSDVQSLLSASNQINNYDKAVEELVCNALDAGATSIAIRINVQENTIQVIDNGCGIFQNDFNLIGQKYTTSKFIDLSTLKSAPNKYGFRGQSLSNLINISKSVKVTSHRENSGETWMKIFEYGKEKQIKMCNMRPSKGTTVEINGLFYNLKIQKKTKNILSNLHSIKIFLEHMSLVHSNVSLSLRDDSKNEIIFKMHKNRDMYQTLLSLYNIKKEDCQEIKVEKNEYKVTAFIGKCENEIDRHFIFLNGKFITNASKLHKRVDNNLIKHFKLGGVKNPKAKNINKDEEIHLFQKKIPYYFIFIKCPYMDYDLSNSAKQSVLEFKDWNQVIKILDKLIQFFNGDINVKEVNKVERHKIIHKPEEGDTREQVKKIMEKILGTHSKKQGTFYMHNGIKGKQVKRKVKIPLKKNAPKVVNRKENNDENVMISFDSKGTNKNISTSCLDKQKQKESKKQATKTCSKSNFTKSFKGSRISKTYNSKLKKVSENKELFGNKIQPQIKHLTKKKSCMCKDKLIKQFEMVTDSVKKRCDELDERVTNKLNNINKRKSEFFVHENVKFKNITRNNVNVSVRKHIDEIIIHDYIPKAIENKLPNRNVGKNVKRKEFQSNYDLVQTILNTQNDNNVHQQNEGATNSVIIVGQSETMTQRQTKVATCEAYTFKDKEPENLSTEPIVTFQSHNYYTHRNVDTENNSYHTSHYCDIQTEYNTTNYQRFYKKPSTFISKQSKDNFKIPNSSHQYKIIKKKNDKNGFAKQFKLSIKRLLQKTHKLFNLRNQIMGNMGDSSHTIEFTESNSDSRREDIHAIRSPINPRTNTRRTLTQSVNYNYSVHNNDHITINTNTYTISSIDGNGYTKNNQDWNAYHTDTIEESNERIHDNKSPNEAMGFDNNYCPNNKNYIFISKSQEHNYNEEILDPINVCETILCSQEKETNKEFDFISNNRQNDLSKDYIENTLFQNIVNDSLNDNFDTYVNEQFKELAKYQHPNDVDNTHNTQDSLREVSHHFSSLPKSNVKIGVANNVEELRNQSTILTSNIHQKTTEKQGIQEVADGKNIMQPGNFNLKNRLCFLPKGMSPIFENCQSKNNGEHNLSGDYYENDMYNNFVNNVRHNAEIFEPKVQDSKELTTRAIDKVNAKFNKDNSSLKFDGESLKSAKILGQIDEKFIAVIVKGRCNKKAISEFLVLFDQHAVDERIRLEKNLADYFNDNQWKPIGIGEVTLKLSNDDILYLHNFKDKFEQLGLQWTVLNSNTVSIDSIPEAILGKKPRQVEKVIKAVKNLIAEEINIIKMQGGCVSLYPKSIMELVFSEACRYAIKFGDNLSKSECVELLKMLSDCKTPFQCAHGRPVMAVIMDIKLNKFDYKVNLNKIMEWKRI